MKTRPMTNREQDEMVASAAQGLATVAHLVLASSSGGGWCLLDWPQIKRYVNECVDLAMDAYEGAQVPDTTPDVATSPQEDDHAE